MIVSDLTSMDDFRLLNEGEHMQDKIERVFCCDLLSVAMNQAPAACAWVTVMANMNTLAVASLADCACIILAHNASLDEASLKKAASEGITIFQTQSPIFDAANEVYKKLND